MGKIKGWRKLDKGSHGSESTIVIYQKINSDEGIIIRNVYGYAYDVILPNSEKRFHNKQQAIDYAIDFMRGHPNG